MCYPALNQVKKLFPSNIPQMTKFLPGSLLMMLLLFFTSSNVSAQLPFIQNDNPSEGNVISQQFPGAFAVVSAQAADDFVVPAGETYTIGFIEVNGNYATANAANNVNIYIYSDNGGVPGSIECSYEGLAPNNDDMGDLGFELPSSCELTEGTYWLSVVVAEEEDADVTWTWELHNSNNGSGFAWQSPGMVLTDCVEWTADALDNCSNLTVAGEGTDLGFALYPALGCDLAELSLNTECTETFAFNINVSFSGSGTYNISDQSEILLEDVPSGSYEIAYEGSGSVSITVVETSDQSCVLSDSVEAPNCICEGSSAQTFAYDSCAEAESLMVGSNGYFSNACAQAGGTDPANPDCFEDSDITGSVWFVFQGDGNNYTISIENCGGNNTGGGNNLTDSQLAVFTGGCGDFALAACNDNVSEGNTLSSLTLNTSEGTSYYLLVDAFGQTDGGEFCIDITEAGGNITNNTCDTATPLAECENDGLTNVGADGIGDPEMSCVNQDDPTQAAVWYSFVATSSNMTVSTACSSVGSLSDTQLTIYAECGGEELACSEDADQPLAEVSLMGLTTNDTYLIMVDGYEGETGDFCISITETNSTIFDCSVGDVVYTDQDGNVLDPLGGAISLCPDATLSMSSENPVTLAQCLPAPGVIWLYYTAPPNPTLSPSNDPNFTGVVLASEEANALINGGTFDFQQSGLPNDLYYLVPAIIVNTEAEINNNPNLFNEYCTGIDPSLALAVEFLDANDPGCESCAEFVIELVQTCETDANGNNTGSATVEVLPIGNTGDIEISGDAGPYLDGETYEICATDAIGCEFCNTVSIDCPPFVDLCETNPISFDPSVECLLDEFGNLTGEFEFITDATGGNGNIEITFDPEMPTNGDEVEVCATDEEGCQVCLTLTIDCQAVDPCEANPITISFEQECLLDNDEQNTGEATILYEADGGNGDLTIDINPDQEVYAHNDEIVICAIDKLGCDVCETYTIDCPPVDDPCVDNPIELTLDYACQLDANGDNTGLADLVSEVNGGNGEVQLSLDPAAELYEHEQTVLVTATDEEGCQVTEEITINCPPPTGDPCEENPITILPEVVCEVDSLGNNTGFANYTVTTEGGNGLVIVEPESGTAEHGEQINFFAIDSLQCATELPIDVSCPVVVDPCDEANLLLAFEYNCNVNTFGNLTGDATLTLIASGGNGEYTYEPSEIIEELAQGDVIEVSVTDAEGCTYSEALTVDFECEANCEFESCAGTDLPWLEELVSGDLWGECYCLVQQVIIEGDYYYYTVPNGEGFCPTDLPSVLYDCNGTEVCADGFIPFEFSCAGLGYTWDFEDPEVVSEIWTCGDGFDDCGVDCSENPIFAAYEYSCIEDEDGCLTGITLVTVTATGGEGELIIEPAEEFEVSNGELISITVTDDSGCSVSLEGLTECLSLPCTCNPIEFVEVGYTCQVDEEGNETGFGILELSATGGEGEISFSPAAGTVVENGEEITVTASDQNNCESISDTFTIDCPPAPECTLSLSVEVACCTASDGLNNGTGQLLISFEGNIGEVTVTDSSAGECLADGTEWTVSIVDEEGCEDSLSGIIECESETCENTIAGTMSTGSLFVCDDMLDGSDSYENNATLGPNDEINFILHTSSTNTLGTILAQNPTPEFNFQGLDAEYNTVYYLSVVVGRAQGGLVDLEHPCTAISEGTPIIFLAPIEILYYPFCEAVLENPIDPVLVTFLIRGGLPGYDATASYTVTGTGFNGQQFAEMQPENIGPIPQFSAYSLTATDGAGCSATIEDLDGYDCGTILSAELLSFTGKSTDQGHQLDWATLSEIELQGFHIEHSQDGFNWTQLHFQTARGDLNTAADYSWTNTDINAGNNYYRLQLLDQDGSIDHSNVVLINESSIDLLDLYPVPFGNTLNLSFNQSESSTAEISIIDVSGRIVLLENIRAKEGHNEQALDVSSLPSGIYFLSLTNANGKVVGKVIKEQQNTIEKKTGILMKLRDSRFFVPYNSLFFLERSGIRSLQLITCYPLQWKHPSLLPASTAGVSPPSLRASISGAGRRSVHFHFHFYQGYDLTAQHVGRKPQLTDTYQWHKSPPKPNDISRLLYYL